MGGREYIKVWNKEKGPFSEGSQPVLLIDTGLKDRLVKQLQNVKNPGDRVYIIDSDGIIHVEEE
jgi:hypothetical protein